MVLDVDSQTEKTVGGIIIPVDKLSLLAPYIGLASTTAIGAVATVVYVRRAKRREAMNLILLFFVCSRVKVTPYEG
jgi:hypothetical protein